jgi:phage tail-like protein
MAGNFKRPVPGFLFHVKIERSEFNSTAPEVEAMDSEAGTAYFKTVEGIGGEQEATDYEIGGNQKFVKKLFGVKKWGNITFSNGVTGDKKLFNWMLGGGRANGAITQLAVRDSADGPFQVICKWKFKDAIPTAWEGPTLDSGKNEIAIEKLTIAHHGLELDDGTPPPEPEPPPEPPPEPSPEANVQFASGSSAVPDSAKGDLNKVAEDMKNNPDKEYWVHGHTDNVGSDSSNMTLSQQRADSTKNYLVQQGAKADKVHAKGFGETKPIGDNNTSGGRAQNRRCRVLDHDDNGDT